MTYHPIATFASKSSPGKVYTVSTNEDGDLSCNCPAWTFQKPGKPRTCKHVAKVARREAEAAG